MPVPDPGLGLEPAISGSNGLILFMKALERAMSSSSGEVAALRALPIRSSETWERV